MFSEFFLLFLQIVSFSFFGPGSIIDLIFFYKSQMLMRPTFLKNATILCIEKLIRCDKIYFQISQLLGKIPISKSF